MLVFIVLSSVAVVAVVAALSYPLWRDSAPLATVRAQRAHRAALKQLDRALRAGALDASVHAAQRDQLAARLAQALAASEEVRSPMQPQSSRRWAVGIAIAVPLMVGGLYWYVGNPAAIERAPGSQARLPSVDQMVEGLARKLDANPNDLQGWQLLGRSYMVLGRYDAAARALAHAHRLAAADPDIALDYAEALVMQSPGALTAEAAPLIEGALASSPANPKGLWLGGLLAQARQNNTLASQRWQTLLTQSGLSAELRSAVEQHLQALNVGAGGDAVAIADGPASNPAVPPAAAAAGQPVRHLGGSRPDGVEVRIALARQVARSLPSQAAVFVFARPPGETSGPPLAVRRLDVRSLPTTVRLSGADSMLGGAAIDAHTPLQITVRVTLHGGVSAQAGDLEGQARYAGDGRPVTISIDRVLR